MSKWNPWADGKREPTIADLLSDPIVQALMRADGVFVSEVLAIVAVLRPSEASPASA
jgi:hypothetical protein